MATKFLFPMLLTQVLTGRDIVPSTPETAPVEFVKKINNGGRMVYDMCENLDESRGYILKKEKPICVFNASYINGTDVVLYSIPTGVRDFFIEKKKEMCNNEKIECGELTILIKILDLINSAVLITTQSVSNIYLNLQIISFDDLFTLYTNTLNNEEVLANITLRRQRADIILERILRGIQRERHRNHVDQYIDMISVYIGEPTRDSFTYCATTISEFIGSLFSMVEISADTKVLLFAFFSTILLIR